MKTEHEIKYCMTGNTPNEVLLRQKAISRDQQLKKAAAKYRKSHKTYSFHLDTVQDAAVIKWIEKQGNKSEAVRRVLRQVIK